MADGDFSEQDARGPRSRPDDYTDPHAPAGGLDAWSGAPAPRGPAYDASFPNAPQTPADDSRYWGPFGPPESQGWYDAPAGPATATPVAPVTRRASTRPRIGAVVAAAAATALLIGGGAGYAGARLAERSEVAPATAAPTVGASSAPSTSVEPIPPGQSTSTVEVAKRLLPSTVMIQAGSSTGSGFVLDQEGHVMTNNHVVAGADNLKVVFADGRTTSATLVGRSPSYDLAVIKIKASTDLAPVQIGDSTSAQVGEPVVAIGSPLGLPGTVTQGIVSAVDRPLVVNESSSADAPTAYINGIQTDAPINPGNSGGPLVDATARVIGVNSAILTMGSSGGGQSGNIGLGFAIPINQAMTIGKLLIADGKATYPVIGASVRESSGGVELTSVEANGPARDAGLRVGDLVTKIDGEGVTRSEELIVAVRTHRPGETVSLTYVRGTTDQQAQVTLGSKEG